MRTYQHVIDTKAVKQTLNSIPDYWVVRDLNERDYGIDLMVEIFSPCTKNSKGHEQYEATGYVCYLQIKGTNTKIEEDKEKHVSFQIDKKTLFYVEKFATPFILIRVCTLENYEEVYFLWLQRYIIDILDVENARWRNSKTQTISVKIPASNVLKKNWPKIERIASRIKFIEEYAEFYERYTEVLEYCMNITNGMDLDLHPLIKQLDRIKNLSTLMKYNTCCIDSNCIEELIEYIKNVNNGISLTTEFEDFPHKFNLNLLYDSKKTIMFVENFVAEGQEDYIY